MKALILALVLASALPGQTLNLNQLTNCITKVGAPQNQPILVAVLLSSSGSLNLNCYILNGVTVVDATKKIPATITLPIFVDGEIPAGTIDGTNAAFAFANTPATGSLNLFLNGQLQTLNVDYTLSGGVATFVTTRIPQAGDIVLAGYRH